MYPEYLFFQTGKVVEMVTLGKAVIGFEMNGVQQRVLLLVKNFFCDVSRPQTAVRNEYRGFYVKTGVVQRRDVSILYSVSSIQVHTIYMNPTSC